MTAWSMTAVRPLVEAFVLGPSRPSPLRGLLGALNHVEAEGALDHLGNTARSQRKCCVRELRHHLLAPKSPEIATQSG